MKRFLLSVALLLACSGVAFAQESEFSGGGGGGVSTAGGSGTAGRIPQFASATSVVDSKMTASGTNSGTWTLYDSTGTTGLSKFVLRLGEDQSDDAFSSDHPFIELLSSAGSSLTSSYGLFGWGAVDGIVLNTNGIQDADGHDGFSLVGTYGGATPMLSLRSNGVINWSSGASYDTKDVGLNRSAAGILRTTDGSTGFGSLRAAAVGAETANGALANIRTISEEINIAGSASTDSAADLLPANSIILSVTARVTTTITTATDWALGDAATPTRFASANATVTAGTTGVGLNHMKGGVATDAAGPVQVSAAKLRITTTGTPGAGAIRVTVTYLSLTPPTS